MKSYQMKSRQPQCLVMFKNRHVTSLPKRPKKDISKVNNQLKLKAETERILKDNKRRKPAN